VSDEDALAGLSVTVRRTGGFAGISRAWALRLTDADEDVAGRLRTLAAAAAGDEGAAAGSARGAADGFGYEVLLESDGGTSQLRGSERSLPPSLAELVGLVQAHGSSVQP
jgi:hypothetical protein